MASDSSLSKDEKISLKNLSDVLKDFISLRPNIPMNQVVVMLAVALDEGKSLKHYSMATDCPTSTVSRAFLDCGPKMRSGEEGLGLLEARPSITSLREHKTELSAKGTWLMKTIAKKMTGREAERVHFREIR